MRGNLARILKCSVTTGSIPAHAGEPAVISMGMPSGVVYPRACGGTSRSFPLSAFTKGLSPRMRGNLYRLVAPPNRIGSIPAHAGEPRGWQSTRGLTRVYPRACGGTEQAIVVILEELGLSPRMRGNRRQLATQQLLQGSIPAHAGEPPCWVCWINYCRVYPRACGGTIIGARGIQVKRGLSPRMRGNRIRQEAGRVVLGSIPAHAGEPRTSGPPFWPSRVYPRACGGTTTDAQDGTQGTGLSPRMRGNHVRAGPRCATAGSIPAHAGEPEAGRMITSSSRVYPRACGGTIRWNGPR